MTHFVTMGDTHSTPKAAIEAPTSGIVYSSKQDGNGKSEKSFKVSTEALAMTAVIVVGAAAYLTKASDNNQN